jgi:hypothetical protein
MYNFGNPWGWYKCIEKCRSDYNINIVKIKYILSIVGWNKNCIQDARYKQRKKLYIKIQTTAEPVYRSRAGSTVEENLVIYAENFIKHK